MLMSSYSSSSYLILASILILAYDLSAKPLHGPCEDGWYFLRVNGSEKCIKPSVSKFREYEEARDYCIENLNAELLTIRSFAENHYVLSLIGAEEPGHPAWPIGFWLDNGYYPNYENNKKLVPGSAMWPNIWLKAPHLLKPAKSEEGLNDTKDQEECVVLSNEGEKQRGFWFVPEDFKYESCMTSSKRYGAICEKKPTRALRKYHFPRLCTDKDLPFALQSPNPNKCYKVINDNLLSFNESVAVCQAMNGELAIFPQFNLKRDDLAERSFLQYLASDSSFPGSWIMYDRRYKYTIEADDPCPYLAPDMIGQLAKDCSEKLYAICVFDRSDEEPSPTSLNPRINNNPAWDDVIPTDTESPEMNTYQPTHSTDASQQITGLSSTPGKDGHTLINGEEEFPENALQNYPEKDPKMSPRSDDQNTIPEMDEMGISRPPESREDGDGPSEFEESESDPKIVSDNVTTHARQTLTDGFVDRHLHEHGNKSLEVSWNRTKQEQPSTIINRSEILEQDPKLFLSTKGSQSITTESFSETIDEASASELPSSSSIIKASISNSDTTYSTIEAINSQDYPSTTLSHVGLGKSRRPTTSDQEAQSSPSTLAATTNINSESSSDISSQDGLSLGSTDPPANLTAKALNISREDIARKLDSVKNKDRLKPVDDPMIASVLLTLIGFVVIFSVIACVLSQYHKRKKCGKMDCGKDEEFINSSHIRRERDAVKSTGGTWHDEEHTETLLERNKIGMDENIKIPPTPPTRAGPQRSYR